MRTPSALPRRRAAPSSGERLDVPERRRCASGTGDLARRAQVNKDREQRRTQTQTLAFGRSSVRPRMRHRSKRWRRGVLRGARTPCGAARDPAQVPPAGSLAYTCIWPQGPQAPPTARPPLAEAASDCDCEALTPKLHVGARPQADTSTLQRHRQVQRQTKERKQVTS